jgi:hypothetical protein
MVNSYVPYYQKPGAPVGDLETPVGDLETPVGNLAAPVGSLVTPAGGFRDSPQAAP